MAHFFFLLIALLAVKTFGLEPNFSKIDRLLEERYNARNQRESISFDPRNYPADMRLNDVNSNFKNDWSKVKNRRHDENDDYVQMRASKPVSYGKDTADGKKMVPIPHPIPVLLPIIMTQPYPVPMFPMNFSAMHKSHPHERYHGHEYTTSDHEHEHEHQSDGHSHEHEHEHEMDGHGHEHQMDGHNH